MCGLGWSNTEATVVCRTLGFPPATGAPSRSAFGPGSLSLWLHEFSCDGTENQLTECPMDTVFSFDDMWFFCDSSNEAGVVCGTPNVTARLSGGGASNQGRVELNVNGLWGTVADREWDNKDGNVVCRMLGLPPASGTPHGALFGQGSGIVWLSHVDCLGNETSLAMCGNYGGWGTDSSTEHANDAGVICGEPVAQLRLVDSLTGSVNDGRVELGIGGVWRGVCSNKWDIRDATVVCKMLGLPPASVAQGEAVFGNSGDEPWLGDLECHGYESSIVECRHGGWGTANRFFCNGKSDAGVICGPPSINVRLNGINSSNQIGRVEFSLNGVWGTICGDTWNIRNAHVICRMMGLPPATAALGSAVFGRGEGVIWLDTLNCTGNENSILECEHGEFGNVRLCSHYSDSGVMCGKVPFCPKGCSCYTKDLFYTVNCSSIELSSAQIFIPNYTRFLYLDGNYIKKISSGTFSSLGFLGKLFLNKSAVQEIEQSAFLHAGNIRALNLKKNKLTIIHRGMFVGLTSLQELDLEQNLISKIEEDAFLWLDKLAYLSLTGNLLRKITNTALGQLKDLSFLSLRNNGLDLESSVPDMDKLSIATSLDLSRNRIKRIEKSIFLYMHFLNMLSLSLNEITYIDNEAFRYKFDLRYLFLDRNRIRNITRYHFSWLGSEYLEILILSGNPLQVIEKGAFDRTWGLRTLILVDTELKTVQLSLFSMLPYLEDIVILPSLTSPASLIVEYPANEFLEETGYTCTLRSPYVCTPCSYGTYKTEEGCTSCPPGGFYQNALAQKGIISHGTGCKTCPPGTYVDPLRAPGKAESDCSACPKGTNLTVFAGFRACFCLLGHYRLDRYGACVVCPRGYDCMNGTVTLSSGFYWRWSDNLTKQMYIEFRDNLKITDNSFNLSLIKSSTLLPTSYACPVADSCLGRMDSTCSQGYKGSLCGVCDQGYFKLLTKCQRCPSLPWIAVQFVVVFVLVFLVAFLTLRDKKKDENAQRSVADILLARFKIVISFYQVTSGTLNAFSYVKWPEAMMSIGNYAGMLQLNLFQIVPVHCLSNSLKIDSYITLLMLVAFNLASVAIPIAYYQGKKFLLYRRGKMSVREQRHVTELTKERCYRSAFLLLFVTYPATCSQIFTMLPQTCHEICSEDRNSGCESFLKADLSVKCHDDLYNRFVGFSYLLTIYPVAFPLVTLLILWKCLPKSGKGNRRKELGPLTRGLRFFYENYSESCWFWEIVELARKVLLTSALLLTDAQSRTYIGSAAIVSGLYTVLFACYKPIKDSSEHWLQLISLMASSVNFTVGMLLKIPDEVISSAVTKEVDDVLITVLLVAANILVIAVIAVQYLATLGRKIWEMRRNPQCSADCCLSLLLTLQEVGDMATSTEQPQLHQETFSVDLAVSELATATADREELSDNDATLDDKAKGGHTSSKRK
ncbi:uncharacterized protein LOC144640962 [Oculina patagonica]